MKEAVVKKWCCENCAKLYDDRGDAKECCPPQPSEIWLCLVCDARFFDEPESKEHGHPINQLTPEEKYVEDILEGKPWWVTAREMESVDVVTPEHREMREILGL